MKKCKFIKLALLGINAFLGFSSELFDEMGIQNVFLYNMIFQIVSLAGIATSMIVIDNRRKWFGRRKQLMTGCLFCGPCLLISGMVYVFYWYVKYISSRISYRIASRIASHRIPPPIVF